MAADDRENQGPCTHEGPHDDQCAARLTLNWLDGMFEVAEVVGYEPPDPFELLTFAMVGIAKVCGYVVSPDDYVRLLDKYAETLDEAVQQRYDREFDTIVADEPVTPSGS